MWVHQWSTPLLDKSMIGVTRLGDPEIVVTVVLANLGWFIARGRRVTALMLIVACVGALALNLGLKLVFARPRPVLWPHLINETSYGFPSGHALGSLVFTAFGLCLCLLVSPSVRMDLRNRNQHSRSNWV